jgi:hypothetical protein
MIESEKRVKELAAKLHDKNKNIVSSAIISLRNEVPFSGAIRLLTELFDKTDDVNIKDLIRTFMNDIKESGIRSEVIKEINKSYKAETAGMLVSSCWQSGLDYSEFAPDLLKIFLKGDYLVSLECLTVIEESIINLSRKNKDDMIKYLNNNMNNKVGEKSALINELISLLS